MTELEALAERINEVAGLPESAHYSRISVEQVESIITALALDEDLRTIWNIWVMRARAAKEEHDVNSSSSKRKH